MKRLITFLFVLAALTAALVGPRAFADPPFLPVAVCKAGKCVISEKDWKQVQAYHMAMLDAMVEIQGQNTMLEDAVVKLKAEIVRHAFCQGRRS